MKQGGVLFLDLSLSVGFAVGPPDMLATGPVWGVWRLPTLPDLGRRLCAFENELCDAIHKYQPSVIGIEAPMMGGKGSAHTAELLLCLSGVAEMVAYRWERRFTRRSSQSLRAQVCGRARVGEDDDGDVKQVIVEPWVRSMGWKITDHNARDASVGWAYEIGVRAPGRKAAA